MKSSMMMIAVISVLGMTAVSHAQTQPKAGQDRARVEYADPAKKCDGLKGDARSACMKDAQKTDAKKTYAKKTDAHKAGKDDMKSAPMAPDTRK